jgi:hypothetical protein
MAIVFQDMLKRFGLTQKILAVNADNATANDKQTTKLSKLDNSFEEEYRAQCFNHTIQLSAKTLLKPFNMALASRPNNDVEMEEEGDDDLLVLEVEEEDSDEEEDDEDADDADNGIDELEELSGRRFLQTLERFVGQSPRYVIMKQKMFAFSPLLITHIQVRQLSFAIIHLTTIALPAWRGTCTELGLKERLIPRDIVTRWNSTYDMMHFVLTYKKVINHVTADKALKLRKYELNNNNWTIVEDLVSILEVRSLYSINHIH